MASTAATVAEVHANLQRTAGSGPAAPANPQPDTPPLSEQDRMMAARLDRLKQDQGLLALLLGQDGAGGTAEPGRWLGAFAPEKAG